MVFLELHSFVRLAAVGGLEEMKRNQIGHICEGQAPLGSGERRCRPQSPSGRSMLPHDTQVEHSIGPHRAREGRPGSDLQSGSQKEQQQPRDRLRSRTTPFRAEKSDVERDVNFRKYVIAQHRAPQMAIKGVASGDIIAVVSFQKCETG
jgi:hypothetical protein